MLRTKYDSIDVISSKLVSLSSIKGILLKKLFLLCFLFIFNVAYAQFGKHVLDYNLEFDSSTIEPGSIVGFKLITKIEKDHYAYIDKFEIVWPKDSGFQNTKLKIVPTETLFDKFSNKEKEVAKANIIISSNLSIPENLSLGPYQIELGLRYQACSKKNCLFPKILTKKFDIILNSHASIHTPKKNIKSQPYDKTDIHYWLSQGIFITLSFVFLTGILTSFTPCIFPMIPITLAVIGSRTHQISKWKAFSLSLSYVLGIALTYSLLGMLAAKTGMLFGSSLSNPWVVGVICSIFIIMALSMFGLFDLKTPDFITEKLYSKNTGKGYIGAFIAGLLAGIVASPCVGPVLVGILTFVAQSQDVGLGFLLLFVYALGLGLIFLVLGTFSNLINKLPRSGAWMNVTKFIFGSSMLAMAIYFVNPLVSKLWTYAFIAIALIFASIMGGLFKPNFKSFKTILSHIILISLFFSGLYFFYLSINEKATQQQNAKSIKLENWTIYSEDKVEAAKKEGKAVLIDFKADWCIACKELELKTFSKEAFIEVTKNMELLFVDATEVDEVSKPLLEKYDIFGLPTVVFIDKKGNIRPELSIKGFEEVEELIPRLKELEK